MKEYKELALAGLMSKAHTDKLEAETSLHILLDHPAGIGDHSTSDLHNNLNEALAQVTDAEDRIETLEKHFPHFFPSASDKQPPF
tara:strand:+ start:5418 stop:5672 length:255 start_codon:yes stop_codon:yes gene_type:complete